MGRIQTTVSRLLPASVLLLTHIAVAAEDTATPDNAVMAAAANLTVNEVAEDNATSPEDAILRMFSLYMEARSTGMLDEAEVLAKQIVEMSITSYGVQSKRTARALTDLGELQASHGDYTAAMLNLARAIEIIENLEDYLSMDLMNPVKTMADVQMQVGATDLAAGNWNRALHISHVNLGPHNADQIETLLALGRLYESAGMTKEANRIRKRIRYLEERKFESMGSALLLEK
jgi:tetratricopeptide (TPR) repeat protein